MSAALTYHVTPDASRALFHRTFDRRRAVERAFGVLPVSFTTGPQDQLHHGIVRDMSSEGVFFYADMRPEPGSTIEVTIRLKYAEFRCIGRVLRVEQSTPNAAVGIAVRFQR